ncbi:hypothetical protein NKH97_30320 [Mesorhizobium sp. M0870]
MSERIAGAISRLFLPMVDNILDLHSFGRPWTVHCRSSHTPLLMSTR